MVDTTDSNVLCDNCIWNTANANGIEYRPYNRRNEIERFYEKIELDYESDIYDIYIFTICMILDNEYIIKKPSKKYAKELMGILFEQKEIYDSYTYYEMSKYLKYYYDVSKN